VEYELSDGCLYLLVAAGGQRSRGESIFPSESFVESVSRGLLQDFGDHLVAQRRGTRVDAGTLIPACAAFLLRASGSTEGPAEIERLLNTQVFGFEKYLPGSSVSQNTQLWRDAKNAKRRVMRVLARI